MANFDVEMTGADVVKALGSNAAGKISIVLVIPKIRLALTLIPVLITGASKNGTGAEIAKTLASANSSLLLLTGRNGAKVDPVIKEIQEPIPRSI